MKLLKLLAFIAIAGLLASYFIYRERTLTRQHANGHMTTGSLETAGIRAETIFRVGAVFLTFDSTDHDSVLWIARPLESLRSLLLPSTAPPFEIEALNRWNDPGRIIWSNVGMASADFMIDLAPAGAHRIAVLRMTCAAGRCSTTTRDRGIPASARPWVGDDGTSLLVDDKTLVLYSSIADLMNNTAGTTLPRLSSASSNELVVTSRDVTWLLGADRSGEVIQGKDHDRIEVKTDSGGTPVAMEASQGFRFVMENPSSTQLWDCPASLLSGSAECTVYTAPASFPHAAFASISNTECGIVISRAGSTWLVRRIAKTQDVLAADGVVGCVGGEIVSFRAGHVSYVTPKRDPVVIGRSVMQLQRSH